MDNKIPDITHPLGKGWDQPSRSKILIDDTHALMDEKTFNQLHEYSFTDPTGAYEGKMWKRHLIHLGEWFLCWFGNSDKPGMVSNNSRKIILENEEA